MRNFFVGLILSLDSNNEKVPVTLKRKYISEQKTQLFSRSSMSGCNILSHILSSIDEELDIEVTEFAPKVFKKIRSLDGLTEQILIESLNPLNNTKILRSQGKGACFFLSTDDSKIILKTLKQEEFVYIFEHFLYFYLHYLETNPDSLICRIYGIYSIRQSYDSDPVLIMLMRDARGPLKKVSYLYLNKVHYGNL